jgi:hypothetical protein
MTTHTSVRIFRHPPRFAVQRAFESALLGCRLSRGRQGRLQLHLHLPAARMIIVNARYLCTASSLVLLLEAVHRERRRTIRLAAVSAHTHARWIIECFWPFLPKRSLRTHDLRMRNVLEKTDSMDVRSLRIWGGVPHLEYPPDSLAPGRGPQSPHRAPARVMSA